MDFDFQVQKPRFRVHRQKFLAHHSDLQAQGWRLLTGSCIFLPQREQLGVPSDQLLVRRELLIPQMELILSGWDFLILASFQFVPCRDFQGGGSDLLSPGRR